MCIEYSVLRTAYGVVKVERRGHENMESGQFLATPRFPRLVDADTEADKG